MTQAMAPLAWETGSVDWETKAPTWETGFISWETEPVLWETESILWETEPIARGAGRLAPLGVRLVGVGAFGAGRSVPFGGGESLSRGRGRSLAAPMDGEGPRGHGVAVDIRAADCQGGLTRQDSGTRARPRGTRC